MKLVPAVIAALAIPVIQIQAQASIATAKSPINSIPSGVATVEAVSRSDNQQDQNPILPPGVSTPLAMLPVRKERSQELFDADRNANEVQVFPTIRPAKGDKLYDPRGSNAIINWSHDGSTTCHFNSDGSLSLDAKAQDACSFSSPHFDLTDHAHILAFCASNPIWSDAYRKKCNLHVNFGDYEEMQETSMPDLITYNDDQSHDIWNWCYGQNTLREVYFPPTSDPSALLKFVLNCDSLSKEDEFKAVSEHHENVPLVISHISMKQVPYNASDKNAGKPRTFYTGEKIKDAHSGAGLNTVDTCIFLLVIAIFRAFA